MLDVFDFLQHKGGDPEKVKESQRRRYAPEGVVEEIQSLYKDARATKYAASQAKQKINAIQKDIQTRKKAKESVDDLLREKAELENEMKGIEASAIPKDIALQKKLMTIGNYVHDSVPISDDEHNNALIRNWSPEGVTLEKRECLSHHEVLTRIEGFDPERAQKIVGHRGYCLTGYGLFLNDALSNYGKHFLHKRGYKAIQPPYFMFREYMAKTAQLEQFDEELYRVVEDESNKESDKYLIATSEQPISALHAGEWMQKKDLPIKYAGFSTCFRKEAGAHGKEAWGIFRVHQFEKIEQFLFTEPEKSWEAFDAMIAISEEFYKSLGLPYQIVAIVSGALNNAAAKKYDLEAWFPYQSEFKELVSCSNCTDYQARALEIRYGAKQLTEVRKKYVHALNSTLCATERALCCVLENYQTAEGVKVPDVLRKWMPDEIDFIPYTKDLPRDSTSRKAKGKAPGLEPKLPSAVNRAADKMEKPLTCPFCNFEDTDVYFLLQHVNLHHPEDGDAPYLVKAGQEQTQHVRSMEGAPDMVECPCGEFCLLAEFQDHLDLHGAEDTDFTNIDIPTEDVAPFTMSRGKASVSSMQSSLCDSPQDASSIRSPSFSNTSLLTQSPRYASRHHYEETSSAKEAIELSKGVHKNPTPTINSLRQPARLSQAELGPYHNEAKMPRWLREMLEEGAKVSVTNQISRDGRLLRIESVANEIRGVVPVLAQLCAQDDHISRAYLCHPDVTDVVKMSKEGGFCGSGHEHFTGRIPSILQLQDMIEHAWDLGFNLTGRFETGGVRGTRKYIGTPETLHWDRANATPRCTADAFVELGNSSLKIDRSQVHYDLLKTVEEYFRQSSPNISQKVRRTSLPPIYFQHRVGFERRKSGACNLLVLDPMFKPSPGITRLLGSHFRCGQPEKLLKAYRRGDSYLKKYKSFEILKYVVLVKALNIY
ncbi:MAG: hypothetical protein Q9217_004925 [Psora testacea]